MAHILLIDDDPTLVLEQVLQVFPAPRTGSRWPGPAQGIENIRAHLPDVILLDLRLPDQSGIDVFQQIRRVDARIPVIFVTIAKGADTAIEAMKQGAYDYLFKPIGLHQLRQVVGEAIHVARRMREPARLVDTPDDGDLSGDSILGSCPAMQEVYKAIGRVASQEVPVLITGESGTGKELVARAIYQHSSRAKEPFLALNCAAIPENLLESELFGHEKGAFTGADRRRIGKFEQCNCGTIFLDEVGDMPPAPGQDPTARAGAGVRARRRQRNDCDGCADRRRDASRPQERIGGRKVSARPLFPLECVHNSSPSFARAWRRPADAGSSLLAPIQPRDGARGC